MEAMKKKEQIQKSHSDLKLRDFFDVSLFIVS